MSNLNVNQLNVFLAAAETLNFTQAAQRLQVSQPSVSQHIQALEEHFGLPLFLRSGRNVELSDAGMTLMTMAREMVYLAQHIEEKMASLKGDVHGHLMVGCSTSTGRYALPKLLAAFHNQYPHVQATCHVASQAEALEMLAQGKTHLSLASNPGVYPDLEFRKFAQERVILIVPQDHPWAAKGKVTVQELVEADFILPCETVETHAAIREALAKLDFSIYQLNTLMTLGSLEAIALSVHEGLGVSFVPEMIYDRLVRGKVVPVQVKDLDVELTIFLARNTRRPATAAQDAFWEFSKHPTEFLMPPTSMRKTIVASQATQNPI